jgi:hypothetical protein
MRLYNQDSAHISENWRKIYQRYGESIKKEVFSKLVSDSNETLLK